MKKLEEGVMEAQNRESQMIEMSQWMTEITQLLQSRLDADILAGDMPKEFEVSLPHSQAELQLVMRGAPMTGWHTERAKGLREG